MSAKRLLIITGPQGSGNHLFSRIFSQHGAVHGWEELKNQYWVPSDQEPFAEYWVQPEKLQKEYFDSSDYFVANVSVPFFYDGVRQFPRIAELARRVQSFGITVVIAVVNRDTNINTVQQQRVGGEATLESALVYYKNNLLGKFECHFISNETFFTWGDQYIDYLGQHLNFPVDPTLSQNLINENPNKKYVTPVDNHWLDDEIRAGRRPFEQRQQDIIGK